MKKNARNVNSKTVALEKSPDAVLLEGVTIQLGGNPVLENVSAHVPRGGSTAIIGPNGAGKTTLALAILGQEPYRGKIVFPPYRTRGEIRFGFVPQKLQFDRDIPMSVMDFLTAGLQRMPLFFGCSRRAKHSAETILEEVECSGLHDRPFGALSGGEIQRVLLASALLRDPEILILDEPTAGVDMKGGRLCCELLQKIRMKRGFTQVMISHDLGTVAAHATHVICLKGTVVAEGKPKEVLNHEVLCRTFGVHLGVPDPDMLAGNIRLCGENCPLHEKHTALAHREETAASGNENPEEMGGKENMQ